MLKHSKPQGVSCVYKAQYLEEKSRFRYEIRRSPARSRYPLSRQIDVAMFRAVAMITNPESFIGLTCRRSFRKLRFKAN